MKQIIDNFDLVLDTFFKEPLSEDEFYFVLLLKRIKDGNFKGSNAYKRTVAYYQITNKQQLIDLKDELISKSKEHNARVYFCVTKRSFSKVNDYVDFIMNDKDTSGKSFESSMVSDLKLSKQELANYHGCYYLTSDYDKKILFDLDDVQIGDNKYNEIVSFIGKENILLSLPSKTGTHIVTKDNKIDIIQFRSKFKFYSSERFPIILYFEWDDETNN